MNPQPLVTNKLEKHSSAIFTDLLLDCCDVRWLEITLALLLASVSWLRVNIENVGVPGDEAKIVLLVVPSPEQ
jgi:hypothetical protein